MADSPLIDPSFISSGITLGRPYHVGIAVHDLDQAMARYSAAFGISEWRTRDLGPAAEKQALMPNHGQPPIVPVRYVYSNTQFPWFELVQPVGDTDWEVPRFLREHGEGINHIGYFVDNLSLALKEAEERGILTDRLRLIKSSPGDLQGIAFLSAATIHGVSMELVSVERGEQIAKFVQTGVWGRSS